MPALSQCAAVLAARYATKAEKGSKGFEKLLSSTLNKKSELDDADNAHTIFASMLVQQTGGRDWTSQEVGHALLGIPTIFASHEFRDASLSTSAAIMNKLSRDTPDHVRATVQTKFRRYLWRLHAVNLSTHSMHQHMLPAATRANVTRDK